MYTISFSCEVDLYNQFLLDRGCLSDEQESISGCQLRIIMYEDHASLVVLHKFGELVLIDKVTSHNKPDKAVLKDGQAVTRWFDCVNERKFFNILKFRTPIGTTAQEICNNFNSAVNEAVLFSDTRHMQQLEINIKEEIIDLEENRVLTPDNYIKNEQNMFASASNYNNSDHEAGPSQVSNMNQLEEANSAPIEEFEEEISPIPEHVADISTNWDQNSDTEENAGPSKKTKLDVITNKTSKNTNANLNSDEINIPEVSVTNTIIAYSSNENSDAETNSNSDSNLSISITGKSSETRKGNKKVSSDAITSVPNSPVNKTSLKREVTKKNPVSNVKPLVQNPKSASNHETQKKNNCSANVSAPNDSAPHNKSPSRPNNNSNDKQLTSGQNEKNSKTNSTGQGSLIPSDSTQKKNSNEEKQTPATKRKFSKKKTYKNSFNSERQANEKDSFVRSDNSYANNDTDTAVSNKATTFKKTSSSSSVISTHMNTDKAVSSTTVSLKEVVEYREEMKKKNKYFANLLFENDNKVSPAQVIDFNNVLNLLHLSHDLDLTDKSYIQVCELLYMCKKFGASQNVKNQLRAYLWTHMIPHNVWSLIVFGHLNEEPLLLQNAWDIVGLNTIFELDSDSFLTIPLYLLLRVVQKDTLSCSEFELLCACERWATHNKHQDVTVFTKHIRFLHINMSEVENSGLSKVEKIAIVTRMKLAKTKGDIREARKEPKFESFYVFAHPAVTSHVCNLQVGQPMDCDTIHATYAIASASATIDDFLFLGIEVSSQLGTRGNTYDEHLSLFIFKNGQILQKIEYKKKKVAYNSIIEIPFSDTLNQIRAHEEIEATVVFHKTGSYKMKNEYTKNGQKFNVKFGNHTGCIKHYTGDNNVIKCFVVKYTE